MAYVRKTKDIWKVMIDYGHGDGYEEVGEHDKHKEAQQEVKEYKENAASTFVGIKIKKQREKILSCKESNFNIEKVNCGNFVVRSDSERFGVQAIVYESYSRMECVEYIARSSKQETPSYYIIEDLNTWANNSPVRSKIERFNTINEAISKFNEYRESEARRSKLILNHAKKIVLGVAIGMCEIDVIHATNDTNFIISDFIGISRVNTNKQFLSDMTTFHNNVGIDKIRLWRDEAGKSLKEPLEVNILEWDNPYFG